MVSNNGAQYFEHLLIPGNSVPAAGFINDCPARWWNSLVKTYPTTYLWIAAAKAVLAFMLLGLYLLAARGIVLAARGVFRGRMHDACLWLLLGTSLYFLAAAAAAAGPIADARLRMPAMPSVCIFASAGFRRTKAIAPEPALAVAP